MILYLCLFYIRYHADTDQANVTIQMFVRDCVEPERTRRYGAVEGGKVEDFSLDNVLALCTS
jgi:hypothetical protein